MTRCVILKGRHAEHIDGLERLSGKGELRIRISLDDPRATKTTRDRDLQTRQRGHERGGDSGRISICFSWHGEPEPKRDAAGGLTSQDELPHARGFIERLLGDEWRGEAQELGQRRRDAHFDLPQRCSRDVE